MKRFWFTLATVGMCLIVGGIAFNFLVKLSAFEEFFLKSRLSGILEGRGYEVLWEKGNYNDLPSKVRKVFERVWRGEVVPVPMERFAEEWREASVVHFLETERGVVFFIERTVHIPQGTLVRGVEKEGPQGMEVSSDPADLPILHSHGHGGQKQLRLQGILDFTKEVEFPEVFPFPEVKSIEEWRYEVGRKWSYRAALAGFLCCIFGGLNICFPWIRQGYIYLSARRSLAEQVQVVRPLAPGDVRKDVKTVEATLVPGITQVTSETPLEEQRQLLIEELGEMILGSSGEQKAALESILTRLAEEPRLSKMQYLVRHDAQVMVYGKEEDTLENIEIVKGIVDILPSPEIERPPSEPPLALEDLLPIDSLVPAHLSPACVKAIILVLLRGGKNPYFGDNSRLFPQIRRSVVGKGFSPKEWEVCFDWLTREGVLLYRKQHKRKESTCSLNPDPGSVPYPGEEIIRVVVRAGQLLAKR